MKKNKITKIAKDLNISHSAVSQWFSGLTTPKYKNMLAMKRLHNIPFEAWEDIKSFINKSVTNNTDASKIENAS